MSCSVPRSECAKSTSIRAYIERTDDNGIQKRAVATALAAAQVAAPRSRRALAAAGVAAASLAGGAGAATATPEPPPSYTALEGAREPTGLTLVDPHAAGSASPAGPSWPASPPAGTGRILAGDSSIRRAEAGRAPVSAWIARSAAGGVCVLLYDGRPVEGVAAVELGCSTPEGFGDGASIEISEIPGMPGRVIEAGVVPDGVTGVRTDAGRRQQRDGAGRRQRLGAKRQRAAGAGLGTDRDHGRMKMRRQASGNTAGDARVCRDRRHGRARARSNARTTSGSAAAGTRSGPFVRLFATEVVGYGSGLGCAGIRGISGVVCETKAGEYVAVVLGSDVSSEPYIHNHSTFDKLLQRLLLLLSRGSGRSRPPAAPTRGRGSR